jgi:hypothetical protein
MDKALCKCEEKCGRGAAVLVKGALGSWPSRNPLVAKARPVAPRCGWAAALEKSAADLAPEFRWSPEFRVAAPLSGPASHFPSYAAALPQLPQGGARSIGLGLSAGGRAQGCAGSQALRWRPLLTCCCRGWGSALVSWGYELGRLRGFLAVSRGRKLGK